MARLDPKSASLKLDTSLRDAVVVLTGGARGIGHATVEALSSCGAKVVFGDVIEPWSAPTNAIYQHTDVTSYPSILSLFKRAHSEHGHVDHAISVAGVVGVPGYCDPDLSIDALAQPPPTAALDVNLRGTIWFSHIAIPYLVASTAANKSITLISSQTGFKEVPAGFLYTASKHGVIGLMRTLRVALPRNPRSSAIRVNAICPGMTDTKMVENLKDQVLANSDAPKINSPESIADVIVACTAAGPGSQAVWYDGVDYQGVRRRQNRGTMDWDNMERDARGMSGRSWFVAEGNAWDIEEGLDRTEDLWMGKGASDILRRGQKVFGLGGDWSETGGATGAEKQIPVMDMA